MKLIKFYLIFYFIIHAKIILSSEYSSQLNLSSSSKKSLKLNNEWIVLTEFEASPIKNRSSLNAKDIIMTKGSIDIYSKKSSNIALNSKEVSITSKGSILTYPVVYNSNRQKIGYLSGNVILKIKDFNDVPNLVSEMRATIKVSYPHLKYLILKLKNGEDLKAFLASWSKDSRITQIELEILTNDLKLN